MNLKDKIKLYSDNLGRMDLKPVDGNLASTNNNLLYSGELAILMHEYNKIMQFGYFDRVDFLKLHSAISMCKVPNFQGLYSRHPEPYRRIKDSQGRVDFRPVSFDEILGASFVSALVSVQSALEIYKHGKNNYWQYNDVPGHEKGVSILSMLKKPTTLFRAAKAYYDEAKSIERDGFRKAAQYYPTLYPIFFTHAASNRVMYRASVGKKSSIVEQLKLLAAVVVASLKSDNISTKVLWFFRFKHLQITKQETFITRLAKRFYKYSERKRFGKKFVTVLFDKYYKDSNHPFHDMVRHVKL